MSYTYYCPHCGMMANAPSCPKCKSVMQRVLRVMEAEELVEQLTLFDEQGAGDGSQLRMHTRLHLRVIQGGKG